MFSGIWPIPTSRPTSVMWSSEERLESLDRWQLASQRIGMLTERPLRKNKRYYQQLLKKIHQQTLAVEHLSDNELKAKAVALCAGKGSLSKQKIPLIFALVKEASKRVLGMAHFDVQLFGGLVMLHGNVAEMQTGEGKTLTATLPAIAAALMGVPVHIVTVNDYLAQRDANEMKPLFNFFGLTMGCIQSDDEVDQRRQHYAADICYCSNNELVFDYLKDQLHIGDYPSPAERYGQHLSKPEDRLPEKLMLRGLHFALIDEADSVLIDEARTPLIISGDTAENPEQTRVFELALEIAKSFPETAYEIEPAHKKLTLTPSGETLLMDRIEGRGPFWKGWVRSLEVVVRALSAIYLYHQDEDYIIRDGKVEIIDEHTGRVLSGRRWEQGLHQLIEIKEQCEQTSTRSTLKQMTYQRFFRRYHHLAGMTGTGQEVNRELWQVYKLPLVRIEPNKKNQRSCIGKTLYATEKQKWASLTERLILLNQQSRSVLVATGNVALSEQLSEHLEQQGIEHQLLNAKTDDVEAEIIAQAGQAGRITIATALAGRGTDIKLSDFSLNSGGLHVILTQLSDASRIDRQLIGRAGRQGEPGSFEWLVSLEDGLVDRAGKKITANSLIKLLNRWPIFGTYLGFQYLSYLQKRIENYHQQIRKQLIEVDEVEGELLSFANSNR